jgi:hypothetical protein
MKKFIHYLKVIILSSYLFIVWCVIFYASVILFPILIFPAMSGLPIVAIAEWLKKIPKLSWLIYLCFTWLTLILPTFGIMPLLIASRLHYALPIGNRLSIFAGFTYTAIYDYFVPSPELNKVDHPFPPVTNAQLYILGAIAFKKMYS